jgi:hypothetical protein
LVPGQSDIGQLALLQHTLGSIDPLDWPEAVRLPDWGKVHFDACPGVGLAAALPDAPEDALDLLASMLRWGMVYVGTCSRPFVPWQSD